MRGSVKSVFIAAMMSMAALPVSAQSVFVSGGAFANIQRFGRFSTQSPTVPDEDLSGTTLGLGVGVGGNIGSHAVAQLELGFPRTLHRTFEPARTLPPLVQPPVVVRRRNDYRSRHASVLLGYRTGTRRHLSAVLLGGLMFLGEELHSQTTSTPAPAGNPLPSENTATLYRMAPVVGFDLAIATSSHLAFVPQVRMYKVTTSSGVIAVLPGGSIRWTF